MMSIYSCYTHLFDKDNDDPLVDMTCELWFQSAAEEQSK